MQILFYFCLSLFVTSIVSNETNYIGLVENALKYRRHHTPHFQITSLFYNEFLFPSPMLAPCMICPMHCQHINSTVYVIPAQLLVDLIGYIQRSGQLNPHFRHSTVLC